MGIRQYETSLEQVGKEVVENLADTQNAILLITGTNSEQGIVTRIFCNNPGRVAGILYGHAVNTGDFKMIEDMIVALRSIAATAETMIEKDTRRKARNN